MPKIALIIPYFGKWPVWKDLYFYSCAQNPDIDFFIFTDCGIPDVSCSMHNLHFNEMTFSDYCDKVSTSLKIDFHPTSAYKLCGLRPFYGYIHADLLAPYDFWGFGDIDLVFGQINHFYTDKMLHQYDVFSTHADRLSGHLAILRNNNYYRNLCFSIPQWQEKLQSAKAIPMDEMDLSLLIYPAVKWLWKMRKFLIRPFMNWRNEWITYFHIVPYLNQLFGCQRKRLYFKEQHTTPVLSDDQPSWEEDSANWIYRNGCIYSKKTGKEHIYFHFMRYKKNTIYPDYIWEEDYYYLDDQFEDVWIGKEGFYPLLTKK